MPGARGGKTGGGCRGRPGKEAMCNPAIRSLCWPSWVSCKKTGTGREPSIPATMAGSLVHPRSVGRVHVGHVLVAACSPGARPEAAARHVLRKRVRRANVTILPQNRAKRQFLLLAAFRRKPCYASHASLPPTHHNGAGQNGVFPRGSYVLVPGPLFALRFSALAGGNVIPPGGLLHGRKVHAKLRCLPPPQGKGAIARNVALRSTLLNTIRVPVHCPAKDATRGNQ